MRVHHFTTPKSDESKESNQDFIGYDIKRKIFAIADGVTTSVFPEIWAKIIVNQFLENTFRDKDLSNEFLKNWLFIAIEKFSESISKLDIDQFMRDLAVDKGAATTFLGCQILDQKKTKKIRIWAIGDSNIFHINNNKIQNLFPVAKIEEFSNMTEAFSSLPEQNRSNLSVSEWEIHEGDTIVIATDAFSKWFLWASINGQKPWNKIRKNLFRMESFIKKLRFNKKINDDDTSFIYIKF
jgi:hypothetical protein